MKSNASFERVTKWLGVTLGLMLAAVMASSAMLWPHRVAAATTLDPNNPGGLFQTEGTQSFTPGSVLTLADTSNSDFIIDLHTRRIPIILLHR